MNSLVGYTKSYSLNAGEKVELYSHFPCTYNYLKLYETVKPNKKVIINSTFSSIDCLIKQSTSTPGILWEKIPIPSGSKYLTVRYDISSNFKINPHPYIRDMSGNVLYWLGIKTNLVSLTPNSVCVWLQPEITHLNIYLIVPMSRYIYGLTFSVKNISFDFTTRPNPSNMIVSLYTHKKKLVQTNLLDPPQDQKFIPNSFAYGCKWTKPVLIPIQSNTASGYYFLRLEYKNQIYWSSLVIRPKSGSTNKILLLANTNKWNAYNTWAGLDGSISLYVFNTTVFYQSNRNPALEGTNGTARTAPIVANFVHTERPNTTASSYINTYFTSDIKTRLFFNDHIYGEMFLPNFLDELGLVFDVLTDQDMEQFDIHKFKYKIFMMHVHPEYWSIKQLRVLNQITKAKVGIIYLAGNGIYWKCTWIDNQMEVRKDRKLHLDGTKGAQFKELKFNDISNGEEIIKIYYSKMYNMNTNPPVPYKLTNFPTWLLQGLDQNLDISRGYIGFRNLNSRAVVSGTSGWEVDNVQIMSNSKYIIGSSNDKLGQIIWKDIDSFGGAVFAAGSIIYTGSLFVDSAIAKMTTNLMNKMLE